MEPYLYEFIGTTLLLLLGNSVVANVYLNQTKAQNSGWLVITLGWAVFIFVAVFIAGARSGAHLNPAVTLGLTVAGKFEASKVPGYMAAQLLGAMAGSTAAWLHYRPHFSVTESPQLKLAVFCTTPAIRSTPANLLSEVLATFVLVFAALMLSAPSVGLGSIDALPIALVVLAIGLCLGGTTGYAINPARDLGPRIMHAILPVGRKGSSDWGYAWIPVVGPLLGGVIAAFLWKALPASAAAVTVAVPAVLP
ncbi:MAG: MIP/aquaporin family protein [Candidatus Sumerlaeaceae bacterium]